MDVINGYTMDQIKAGVAASEREAAKSVAHELSREAVVRAGYATPEDRLRRQAGRDLGDSLWEVEIGHFCECQSKQLESPPLSGDFCYTDFA